MAEPSIEISLKLSVCFTSERAVLGFGKEFKSWVMITRPWLILR